MKERDVLTTAHGAHHDVLETKPPIACWLDDVELLVSASQQALSFIPS